MDENRERLERVERKLREAAAQEDAASGLERLASALELLGPSGRTTEAVSGVGVEPGAMREWAARLLLARLSGERHVIGKAGVVRLPGLLYELRPELERMRAAARVGRQRTLPEDGATVEINPPPLTWCPIDGAGDYLVEVQESGSELVWQARAGADPVHLPARTLEPGRYQWGVEALDLRGRAVGRVGPRVLQVPPGLPRLLPPTGRQVLAELPGSRPRLLFSAPTLGAVRAKLNGSRRETWQGLLERAEKALSSEAPPYPEFHRVADRLEARLQARRYLEGLEAVLDRALLPLALAHVLSREERFAEAGKRILLHVARWPVEDGDPTSVSSSVSDGPGLSLLRCLPRAYDWLHRALRERERRLVREACRRRAEQALARLRRRNYFSYPGDSHAGRLIPALGEMGLVLAGECEEAEGWLDYSLKALTTCYPYWGGVDGGWAEGTVYAGVYNRFYIPLFETLRESAGIDLWKLPFYSKLGSFFLYCLPPAAEVMAFGDGALASPPVEEPTGDIVPLVRHLAHRFDDRHLAWWAEQAPSSMPGGELDLLPEGQLESEPPSALPSSRLFRGVGWAALHSRLHDPVSDTVLLFKSSSFGSISHSHADQNGFCLMKGGRALAVPSGYYGPVAGTPHHVRWTAATKASNCLLVDGRGQHQDSAEARGEIVAFADSPLGTYVAGEAGAAYAAPVRSFRRHVLFVRPCLFMILDELEAEEPVRCQWLLHTLEPMTLGPGEDRLRLRRGSATLEARLYSPGGLRLSQSDRFSTPYNEGLPEAYWRDLPNQWHLTAETENRGSSVRIAAALVVGSDDETYRIETRLSGGWFAVRAVGKGVDAEVRTRMSGRANGSGMDRRPAGGEALPIVGRSDGVELSF